MKMAILGAGGIAQKMATTIREMPEVESYAIGARSLERAQAFAKEFGIAKAYGSYEDLVSDPEIDLIYVATPHSHHYECVKLCLNHGKNVLCEKAFTVNATQAKELIALATSKKLLLAEAIWTRYMPMRQMILDTMNSGVVGKITSLSANLGYNIDHVKRIQEPELAGGALLDLAVYTINLVSAFFGDDMEKIVAVPTITDKGVDSQNTIIITYPDGKMATVYTTTMCATDREAVFNGNKGFIKVTNTNNYEDIRIYDTDLKLVETIVAPPQITGFEYEVLACKEAIENGWVECPLMPHASIIRMMEIMDGIRADWGMKFPCE